MSKTSFTTTALASIFLLAAASFGASTSAMAQAPLQDQFQKETAPQAAPAEDPATFRAATESEEEFSTDEAATRADNDDNLPENTNRLMILDSHGRPYMYDGVRDGVTCRARRVLVRRNAWGTATYRRTISCRGGLERPAYNQQPYGQPYNEPYRQPSFRN